MVLGNITVTFIFLCSVLLMITLIDGTSSREKISNQQNLIGAKIRKGRKMFDFNFLAYQSCAIFEVLK